MEVFKLGPKQRALYFVGAVGCAVPGWLFWGQLSGWFMAANAAGFLVSASLGLCPVTAMFRKLAYRY
jgi:hypothetical protein